MAYFTCKCGNTFHLNLKVEGEMPEGVEILCYFCYSLELSEDEYTDSPTQHNQDTDEL